MLADPYTLAVDEGYLSVWGCGTDIQGGGYLVLSGSDGAPTGVVVGAAFAEPYPWSSF